MIRPIKAILLRNLLKLQRDKMKLFMNLFMSGLFLFIFSFIMKSAAPGMDHPMNYLISGIIIMTVFQSALSNSMNILEDITSGVMKEILVAPITRWQIAIGHVLSATVVSVIQGLIIVIIGMFMGLTLSFWSAIAMVGLMLLVGLTFSTLGLYLATLSKESSNFQLLIAIVSFPLTFLSGAYIPTMALPKILLPLVYLNPLTYTTAAFRFITLHLEGTPVSGLLKAGVAFDVNGFIITPLLSFLFIGVLCAVFFVLCVNRFNSADFSRVKIFKHAH
ncbi:ABC-2 type transporter [Paludibacter propionicigenes WB4]|uniref:Transport permease protein n=1 Tax=Paludibacter propionicigenes (strain DSM 17365 / JCM 13257 / WB4) TaxID=694427 RepID=E4T0Q8_PALPW|nr:ABC transporter permease [Paludibacter propionicigenes]ADQ78183.1 ABC-2 type transporter [Paludibacter propionicigenes WB4]